MEFLKTTQRWMVLGIVLLVAAYVQTVASAFGWLPFSQLVFFQAGAAFLLGLAGVAIVICQWLTLFSSKLKPYVPRRTQQLLMLTAIPVFAMAMSVIGCYSAVDDFTQSHWRPDGIAGFYSHTLFGAVCGMFVVTFSFIRRPAVQTA